MHFRKEELFNGCAGDYAGEGGMGKWQNPNTGLSGGYDRAKIVVSWFEL